MTLNPKRAKRNFGKNLLLGLVTPCNTFSYVCQLEQGCANLNIGCAKLNIPDWVVC